VSPAEKSKTFAFDDRMPTQKTRLKTNEKVLLQKNMNCENVKEYLDDWTHKADLCGLRWDG